jgi:hypothetical protein
MALVGCSAENCREDMMEEKKSTQVDGRTFVKLEGITAVVWQASMPVLMRDADCIPTR